MDHSPPYSFLNESAPATPGTTTQDAATASSPSLRSYVPETPPGRNQDLARTRQAARALVKIYEDETAAPSSQMTVIQDTPPSRQPLRELTLSRESSPELILAHRADSPPARLTHSSSPTTSEEMNVEEWDSQGSDKEQDDSALLLDTSCSRIPRVVNTGHGKHLQNYAELLTQSTTLVESAMKMGAIISIVSSISTENSKQKMYTGSVLAPPDQVRAQAALDTLIATYCLFRERLSTFGTMSQSMEILSTLHSKDHLLEVLTQHARTCGQEAFHSQQKASFLRTLKIILRATGSCSTDRSITPQTASTVQRWRPQECRITKPKASKSTGRPTQRQDDGYWRAYATRSIESNDWRETTPTPQSKSSSTEN